MKDKKPRRTGVSKWLCVIGTLPGMYVLQGCPLISDDGDLLLQAGLSVGSEFTIFLLENLIRGL